MLSIVILVSLIRPTCKCPELRENPFRKRICKIFSTDGSGDLSLNEFFLLFSSLCERAPRDIKLHYAFSIYDFDGDNFIGVEDIEQVIRVLSLSVHVYSRLIF